MECLGDRKVANNRPFGGTIVPKIVYQQDHRVSSVMIEINRRLYMTEEPVVARSPDFELVHSEIQHCLEQIAACLRTSGGMIGQPLRFPFGPVGLTRNPRGQG
jgi:N-formylglutamate amidohydrolase